ncbi:hypothetical protein BAGA_13555 [Bacillus gaemokensis]|uniref:Uncharacterized protein n=1 Tax=Bacillus gaemokensis TaxID=574375 RepID=A0A073KGB5_9BACI|nr:hypothetical protein BAGA_13555 [Bacillus gaemokensis]KYG36930.1 hypothetical protein AZF08_05840 [Bacillus gaemokensis]
MVEHFWLQFRQPTSSLTSKDHWRKFPDGLLNIVEIIIGHNKWRNRCLDCNRISNVQNTIVCVQIGKMVI